MAVILPSVYRDGTTTVAAGGTIVTGQGTLFTQSVLPGDFYGAQYGYSIMIARVDSDTQLTLDNNWPGPAQSAAPYKIMLQSDMARVQETTRQTLEALRSGNIAALSALVASANTMAYFTGPGAVALTDLTAFVRANVLNKVDRVGVLAGIGVSTDMTVYSRRSANLNNETRNGSVIAVDTTLNNPPVAGGFIVNTRTWENDALAAQEALEFYPVLGRRWIRYFQQPSWTGWTQQVMQSFASVQENGGLQQNAAGSNKLSLGYSNTLQAPAITVDATNFGRVWTDATCQLNVTGAFGYQRFATGVMLQWGQQVGGGSDVQINYPWGFVDNPYYLTAVAVGSPAGTDAPVVVVDQSLPTLFVIRRRLARNGGIVDSSSSFTVFWSAFGRWR